MLLSMSIFSNTYYLRSSSLTWTLTEFGVAVLLRLVEYFTCSAKYQKVGRLGTPKKFWVRQTVKKKMPRLSMGHH